MKSIKHLYILLFAITLLGFLGWQYVQNDLDGAGQYTHQKEQADSIMQDVTLITMGKNGKPKNQISSPKVMHYQQGDNTSFESPNIIMYQKKGMPWYISAQSGQSIAGFSTVILSKNVKFYRPPGPHNNTITLTTSRLSLFPHEEIAQTDQAVTMTQPGSVIKSVGLRAYLKSDRVELLSRAEGSYESHP